MYSTRYFSDCVRRFGTGKVNTKESNNKSTESSKTETELKAMRNRSEYSKARPNKT